MRADECIFCRGAACCAPACPGDRARAAMFPLELAPASARTQSKTKRACQGTPFFVNLILPRSEFAEPIRLTNLLNAPTAVAPQTPRQDAAADNPADARARAE